MYRVLQGAEPAPENVTPQCVLDALGAQGLHPAKPAYARQRIALMKVCVDSWVVACGQDVWLGHSLHSVLP